MLFEYMIQTIDCKYNTSLYIQQEIQNISSYNVAA